MKGAPVKGAPVKGAPVKGAPIRRLAAALALLVAGCTYPDFKLIDQQTFANTPAPTQADIAHANLPPLPLVVIRFNDVDPDYHDALAAAVTAAMSRKPDAVFDVLTPIPLNAPASVQAAATAQGRTDATEIATALAADGVAPDHVHIGFHGDSGTPPREVQVYVR